MLEKIGDPQFAGVSTPNVHAVRLVQDLIETNPAPTICEVGIGVGATTIELCRILDNRGKIFIFDYANKVTELAGDLANLGFRNIVPKGNSAKTFDSYSWELAKLALECRISGTTSLFDFAFLDGAHVFLHDAPAAVLLKEMLKENGVLLFDDYAWTLGASPTMNPQVRPATAENYTDEQVRLAHIEIVCRLFMDADSRYALLDLGTDNIARLRRAYRRRAMTADV